MKNKLKYIVILIAMILTLTGCSSEQPKSDAGDNGINATKSISPTAKADITDSPSPMVTEKPTEAPADTVTPSPKPTKVPEDELPTVDSGSEVFVELTEEQARGICEIKEQMYPDTWITGWVVAYYSYFDKMDTKIPVVVKATAEEVNKIYPGTWIPVRESGSEDKTCSESYGILTVSDIEDIIINETFEWVWIAADETVSTEVEVLPMSEYGDIYCDIAKFRKRGGVSVYYEMGEYLYWSTHYPS